MIKVITIVGARPQIIKAAAISRCIRKSFSTTIKEIIVHTGQHYDDNMSEIFFREMDIPAPEYNLNLGSSSHAIQTALMMDGIEKILINETPDLVILYGDTNSTLAGSVTAAKLHLPVLHIEAGLRSFNKAMPEEINRIVCDHVSTMLFSPTATGLNNLQQEGFRLDNKAPYNIDNPAIFHCGDVMFDNCIYFTEIAKSRSSILNDMELVNEQYILATIHRDNNTDNPKRLNGIFSAINTITSQNKVKAIIPLHPRTEKVLKSNLDDKLFQSVQGNSYIHIIQPVSFFDIINLEKNSMMILTDSGGMQKEAYFYNKPCVVMRSETEWVEIVNAGAAMVCDADEEKIIQAFEYFRLNKLTSLPAIFGNGKASEFICDKIIENF
jgi:UDP-GlcNAc3NAcA epimerase